MNLHSLMIEGGLTRVVLGHYAQTRQIQVLLVFSLPNKTCNHVSSVEKKWLHIGEHFRREVKTGWTTLSLVTSSYCGYPRR